MPLTQGKWLRHWPTPATMCCTINLGMWWNGSPWMQERSRCLMVRMDRSTSPTWQSAGTIFMLELCIRWASNFTVGFSSSVSSLYLLARKIMLLISHYRNHGVTNNSTVGIIRVVHIQSSRVLLELYFSAILMMINACCFNRCIHCYTTDFLDMGKCKDVGHGLGVVPYWSKGWEVTNHVGVLVPAIGERTKGLCTWTSVFQHAGILEHRNGGLWVKQNPVGVDTCFVVGLC